MDVVFFVIFVSMLAVAMLVALAFFPIQVSWFYQRKRGQNFSQSTRTPRPRRSSPPRTKRNAYKDYARLEEDTFDDPEL